MAIVTEPRVPPLRAGDELTREEFLRRWEAHPKIKLAELIGGIVYMPSSVSLDHGGMDGDVGCCIYTECLNSWPKSAPRVHLMI